MVKLKSLFTINFVISSVFGLALVLVPVKLYEIYGQQLDPVATTTARMWGTAVCGYAVLTWLFRNLPDSEARRKVVLALFIYFSIGFFVNVFNQLTVPLPPVDWSTPIIFLLLALGYGYFHFKKI